MQVWGRRSVERRQNKLQTRNARWKRVRFHFWHASHSETDAHFRKLPSLSFCAAFPKRDSLKRQLPVEEQRPGCVVFHKFRLKGWNEANKSVFFSLRETDLCIHRAQFATLKAVSFVETMFLFPIQPYRATIVFRRFACNSSGWLSMRTSTMVCLMFMQLDYKTVILFYTCKYMVYCSNLLTTVYNYTFRLTSSFIVQCFSILGLIFYFIHCLFEKV